MGRHRQCAPLDQSLRPRHRAWRFRGIRAALLRKGARIMFRLTINGRPCEVREDTTIMEALRQLGEDVPALCHDERLQPSGACRLCVVEVKGWNRHATACSTPVLDGMEIQTHSPSVEDARRTLL